MKGLVAVGLGVALLAAAPATLPRGGEALTLLTGPRDEAAVADYVVSHLSSADFEAAAERALAQGDADLAASIAALAEARGLALSPALAERIAAAEEVTAAGVAGEAWNGFVSGDAPTGAALAGVVAADLSGAGDIRDLFDQARRYVQGEEVDPYLTGFAAAGLGITAATFATAGLALPARTGLSTLKVAKRAGKLSPALAREVGVMVSKGLAEDGLKATAASFERLGTDIATIGKNSGYRTTMETLGAARSADEVGTVARLSSRFGKATRAVLVMGGTAFTFASLAGQAAFWTISALAWVLAALLGLSRIGTRIGRWLWPKPLPRPRRRQTAGTGFFRCMASQAIMTRASTTMGNTA